MMGWTQQTTKQFLFVIWWNGSLRITNRVKDKVIIARVLRKVAVVTKEAAMGGGWKEGLSAERQNWCHKQSIGKRIFIGDT